ncbi:MAG TPA: hypothetical protein VE528_02570, partial [Thermoleophilaceae bacterium]|nr:hypothetical protein [Thermoleophilaceae bacterium]
MPLLFASGGEIYPRFAGSPEAALRVGDGLPGPGNTASAEVVWVAEVDGRLVGRWPAFPVPGARFAHAAFSASRSSRCRRGAGRE